MEKTETLKKLEEFNRRSEEARKQASGVPQITPTIPGAGLPLTEDQQRILSSDNSTLNAADRVAKKALETQGEVERAEKIRQQQERQQLKEQDDLISRTRQAGQRATDDALDTTSTLARWLERAPTVFGLGTIIAIILVFELAIVPINPSGHTRLQLIWLTITGRTHLSYQDTAGGGSGASGSFASYGQTPQQAQQNAAASASFQNGSQVSTANILASMPNLSGLDLTNL